MQLTDIIELLEHLYISYGYAIAFFSSFVETSPLGFTIPGGLFLAIGGFFAYSDKINLAGLLIFGFLGGVAAFLLAYFLGLKTGTKLIKRLKQEKYAGYAKTLLKKHGGVILTTSMLANLTRFWVAYVAGMEKYNLSKFIFYSSAASLTWSSLMVMVGYLAGAEVGVIEETLSRLGYIAWGFLALTILVIYIFIRKEKSKNDTPGV